MYYQLCDQLLILYNEYRQRVRTCACLRAGEHGIQLQTVTILTYWSKLSLWIILRWKMKVVQNDCLNVASHLSFFTNFGRVNFIWV